jgi:hypothetical protein
MKMLHIIRSKPNEETLTLIAKLSKGNSYRTINLFENDIDYDELVKLVFISDRVISWW